MAHLSCVGETTAGPGRDPGSDRGGRDRERLRAARRPAARREDFEQPEGGLGSAAELAALHLRRLGLHDRRGLLSRGAPRGARPRHRPRLPEDEGRFRGQLPDHPALLRQPGLLRLRRARRAADGIEVPILAGVIPVAGFAQTKRICELCDATHPGVAGGGFSGRGGRPRARVRAWGRLRGPAVRGAADRRCAGHPLLRAEPGAGDARRARRAARARPWDRADAPPVAFLVTRGWRIRSAVGGEETAGVARPRRGAVGRPDRR